MYEISVNVVYLHRRGICSVGAGFSASEYMRKYLISLAVMAAGLFCVNIYAQNTGDVFSPIVKYIEKGDAESLSAWFADNLEISIFSRSSDTSRNQAKQIMKSFFKSYTPRTFVVSHKAGRPNMKYALGILTAGGEMFQVTIFVGLKDTEYKIQQIKIERID